MLGALMREVPSLSALETLALKAELGTLLVGELGAARGGRCGSHLGKGVDGVNLHRVGPGLRGARVGDEGWEVRRAPH